MSLPDRIPFFQLFIIPADFLQDLLGFLLIIPEIRCGGLFLQFPLFFMNGVNVKDTPGDTDIALLRRQIHFLFHHTLLTHLRYLSYRLPGKQPVRQNCSNVSK